MKSEIETEASEPLSQSEEIAKEAAEREQNWSEIPPAVTDPQLEDLRKKLFAREIFIVNKLKQMLDGGRFSANEMMKVISDSIVTRAGKDERFSYAMSPMIEKIVANSMKTRQSEFVDLLFPLMGPSIRKSIAENLRTMLNSFSESLENSLSWRGLRWRFEGWRTGKSFSDVVLLHTIVYRVDEIFFVHCETGLVLSHLVRAGVENQDADMVSAMLTAINDFVRDCFQGSSDDNLEALNLGDRTIVIEKQDFAYIACVVRGSPPLEMRVRVRDALDQLRVEYAAQIAEFNGDTAPFQHSSRLLEPLLEERYVKERKPLPTWGKAIAVTVLVALLGLFGYLFWRHLRWENELARTEYALNSEPGILVIGRDKTEDGKVRFILLRDELSREPKEVIANRYVSDSVDLVYTPFVSLEPPIVEKRAVVTLQAPEDVTMEFDGQKLTLSGTAPIEWIGFAKRVLQNMAGVQSFDVEDLYDPYMDQIAELIVSIEDINVEFATGKSDPIERDKEKLERVVDMLTELEAVAVNVGMLPSLIIYGHADRTGSAKYNYEISQARARTLAAMLYERGSLIPVEIYGMGSNYPRNVAEKPEQSSRRIELKVRLLQASGAR
jgi:OOP family OmpA-OmpF porin